jgi:S-DNA-T family DNA segregation ATPase FtsK/SpoIIIE
VVTGVRILRDAGRGLRWWLRRLGPYLVASREYGRVIEHARDHGHPYAERRFLLARRRTVSTRLIIATGAVVVLPAAAYGFVGALAAARGGWWVWPLAVALTLAPLAAIGRGVRRAGTLTGTAPAAPAGDGPPGRFPIADAHTRAEAARAVLAALAAEGINADDGEDVRREAWGWRVPVILDGGTPAQIVAKLAAIEGRLDVAAGAVLAAPDRQRRARVVLRILRRDPFTPHRFAPYREPNSGTIREPVVIGRRMDGDPLAVSLDGVHVLIVGVTGAGKTVTLAAIGDALTACPDAVVWDLDPIGSGLDLLGGAVSRRERTPAGIEAALADALAMAETRPRLLSRLGMGASWRASAARPALVVVIDEYPRLSPRAKEAAIGILRAGRKARVTLVLATSEATSDALGEAVAEMARAKIMLACRHVDVRLALGPSKIDEGWHPHRLHAEEGDSIEDAGRGYVYAAGNRDPVVSMITPPDPDRITTDGDARAATRPVIDADTLAAAGVTLAGASPSGGAGRAGETGHPGTAGRPFVPRPRDPAEQDRDRRGVDPEAVIDILIACDGLPKIATADLLARLATLDARYSRWTPETLAGALRPLGIAPGPVRIGERVAKGYTPPEIANAWRAWRVRKI